MNTDDYDNYTAPRRIPQRLVTQRPTRLQLCPISVYPRILARGNTNEFNKGYLFLLRLDQGATCSSIDRIECFIWIDFLSSVTTRHPQHSTLN